MFFKITAFLRISLEQIVKMMSAVADTKIVLRFWLGQTILNDKGIEFWGERLTTQTEAQQHDANMANNNHNMQRQNNDIGRGQAARKIQKF